MSIEEWTWAIMMEPGAPPGPSARMAARYVIRRLADPACAGSEEALARIRERRQELRARARAREIHAVFDRGELAEIQDGEEVTP